MVRVFTNDPGDWGSIPGRVIPKTQKMVFDSALLSTKDLAINNQQWLICNKTQPNQISKYLSNNG